MPTVEDVFELVERRQAVYGVVPIENSLEGAVTHTLDRFVDFVDTPVRIQGEVEQPIRHALIEVRPADAEPVVIISADANASHQAVVTVMDAARQAGLTRITFPTSVREAD